MAVVTSRGPAGQGVTCYLLPDLGASSLGGTDKPPRSSSPEGDPIRPSLIYGFVQSGEGYSDGKGAQSFNLTNKYGPCTV